MLPCLLPGPPQCPPLEHQTEASSSLSLSNLVEDSLSDSKSLKFARVGTNFSTLVFGKPVVGFGLCVPKQGPVAL